MELETGERGTLNQDARIDPWLTREGDARGEYCQELRDAKHRSGRRLQNGLTTARMTTAIRISTGASFIQR